MVSASQVAKSDSIQFSSRESVCWMHLKLRGRFQSLNSSPCETISERLMGVIRCGGPVCGASECWIHVEVLEAGKT